jgi:hypothetical protein
MDYALMYDDDKRCEVKQVVTLQREMPDTSQ